jgi:hypothetical protein
MPRGGHNKKRPVTHSGPAALTKWPHAPSHFSEGEVRAWKAVGEAAMLLGSVSGSDLLLAGRLAQLGARVDAALMDADAQMTAVSSMMRLEADLLNRMGLTPQARNTIGPLSKPSKKGPLDDF